MNVPSVEMLLIAARAVFLLFSFVLATVACIRWRRATLAQTGQLLAQHTVVLQRLADLETRIDATNVSISKLEERLQRPQQLASASASTTPGYQIAIRLARSGATLQELTSGCGLSSHEAELVYRLHSPHSRPGMRKQLAQPPNAA